MTEVITFVRGVVTIVTTPVHTTDNYVLRNRPSIQIRTLRALPTSPRKFSCIVEYDNSQETRSLYEKDLAKIIIQNEEKAYLPTIQQIQCYTLWNKLGEEIEFPILEIGKEMGQDAENDCIVVDFDV